MLKHTTTTLKSGLTVIQIPIESVKSATVLTLSNTGSRYETSAKQGIAHFFEHIVFKGTENYPTTQDLAEVVDSVGANFNAFTSKEYTGYYVKAASKHVNIAIEVLSDMLMAPRLRQTDIDKEKGVIIEELNMYRDMPSRHISDLFDQMVFEGGLSHDIIGTKDTIRSITSQDFQDFLNKWYGHGNILVIVAGDASVVMQDAVLWRIQEQFGKGSPEKRQPEKQELSEWIEQEKISTNKLHVEFKETEQAHFVMGWPGIERGHGDRFNLSVLNTILGSSFSSRLFTEVREKRGLCYYVHSDLDMLHGIGMFGASAGVDPKRVEEAVRVTIDQFTSIADGSAPITEKEVTRAKEYICGKLVLSLEDSQTVAQYYGLKQLLRNTIETPDDVMEKIRAVSLDDIHRVAKSIIKPGELRFAIIGPYKDESVFQKFV